MQGCKRTQRHEACTVTITLLQLARTQRAHPPPQSIFRVKPRYKMCAQCHWVSSLRVSGCDVASLQQRNGRHDIYYFAEKGWFFLRHLHFQPISWAWELRKTKEKTDLSFLSLISALDCAQSELSQCRGTLRKSIYKNGIGRCHQNDMFECTINFILIPGSCRNEFFFPMKSCSSAFH